MSDSVRLDRFLDRVRGLSSVKRWNFHTRLTEENVAEHSYWVTFYTLLFGLMSGLSNNYLLDAVVRAVLHDIEESVTGDLPMLVKREVGSAWRNVEHQAMRQLWQFLPEKLSERLKGFHTLTPGLEITELIQKLVKAADVMDVIMYCRIERQLGNQSFGDIECEAVTILRRMDYLPLHQVLDAFGYSRSVVHELPQDMTHL